MEFLRPGGMALTERVFDFITSNDKMPEDYKVLDIGCGDGTAAEFIKNRYDADVYGIDTDEAALEKAKAKGITVSKCDAVLLDFPSKTFDVVMFENVFTMLDRQEESFHEAYCVLKNGGFLVINDFFNTDPDHERFAKDYDAAMLLFRRPRHEGDCEAAEHLPSPYNQDGALVLDGLKMLLDDLKYKVVFAEDHPDEMNAFAAQAALDYGSVENYFAEMGWNFCCEKPGYLTLIAQKPWI